jgi:hypothetical protein
MSIEIKEFRRFEKKTLKGFLTVLLPSVGLQIRGCTVHESHGKRWVSLPASSYANEDGSEGHIHILRFSDEKFEEAFQRQTLEAIDEYFSFNQATAEISDEDINF